MKQKYKYEIDTTLDHNPNKPLYRLKTTKAGKEITKVVGIGALRTMYNDKAICGHIPPYLKEKIGAPRRKTRSDKKGYVPSWNVPDEMNFAPGAPVRSNWAVPEEFKVEPVKALNIAIKAYCYEKDGKFHVVGCDGIEIKQKFDVEEWAQEEVGVLNAGI